MVWTFFVACEPGELAIIDLTINPELYEQIQRENVRKYVHELSSHNMPFTITQAVLATKG